MAKKLFVIDAMAMAFRNHYAFGMRPLTTSSGEPTSAIFGSAIFMNKLIQDHQPDYLVIATDTKQPTFRHVRYPAYKANRDDMPEDLVLQLPNFFKLFEAYGIPTLRFPGFEADDIIGTIAKQMAQDDLEIYIVSGDKDFMQLINDKVFLFTPKKGGETALIDRKGVELKFGVEPEKVIDVLAIMGDASDNVPGVFGIGEKGAAKLIQAYGSLDGVYENLTKITAKRQREGLESSRENAFLSKELVTIKTDMDLGIKLEDLVCDIKTTLANNDLLTFFEELEFKGLAQKVRNDLSPETLAPAASAPAPAATERAGATAKSYNPELVTYTLVDTKAKLRHALRKMAEADTFCFDTETTGLNVVNDTPIGISLCAKPGEAFYVPLVEKHLDDLSPEEVIEALKPILSEPNIEKVGHNLKFDLQMLTNIGIEVTGPFADTMVEDHLIDAASRSHGLDACCLRHLEYEKIPTAELIGKKADISMLDVPLTQLCEYACEDVDQTLQLHQKLYPILKKENLLSVFHHVEMPLVKILAKMEQQGIYIDSNLLGNFSEKLEKMATQLETKIHNMAGCDFNIKSPKQLATVLFENLKVHEQLGIKKLKKTKTGYSTNEAVLSTLVGHPLPATILEYRSVMKLKSTYVDVLPKLINTKTGRVHTSFHQIGTATGRLSSSNPNLQNIPIRTDLGQEIRRGFKPQSDNTVLVSADYSQVELRILAHIADESHLCEAFSNEEDIHSATAAKIFGVELEAVDSEMRSRAKAINFGIIYGMGPKRLSQDTGVTMKEASEFIKKYFAGYPGIKTFIDASKERARETEMTYSITGRRRPVPGINGKDRMALVAAENVAVNTPIQGSAADLIKLAMIKVDQAFRERGLNSRMLLQVHDELVFEVERTELEEVCKVIKESMESAMTIKVPLKVDIGSGANWLEAH
jgi:DNA polymerase-1